MKEKKEKKVQTPEEQLGLAYSSVIIWSILSIIWIGLGVAKLVTGDDWWMIALDFFVGGLSALDVFLGVLRVKKIKKAIKDKNEQK